MLPFPLHSAIAKTLAGLSRMAYDWVSLNVEAPRNLMAQITLLIPPEVESELFRLAGDIGSEPAVFASEALTQQLRRLQNAITLYRSGTMSLGAFAEATGLGVIEADQLLARLHIDRPYVPGQIAADANRIDRLLSRRPA